MSAESTLFRSCSRPRAAAALLLLFLAAIAAVAARAYAQDEGPLFRLAGHTPAPAQAGRYLGRAGALERVDLALTLPLRNQGELQDLLGRLSDPQDPEYGHYLTGAEFTQRFAPTPAQYAAVAHFARSHGLTVTGTHPNRLILDVAAPVAVVERAFHTRLSRYQARDGRIFRAPDEEPAIPTPLIGALAGVAGLNGLDWYRPHLRRLGPAARGGLLPRGSGPGGGLTPGDIRQAYNLANTPQNGSGQTLALFELDGYTAADISAYETQFNLPATPLQNIYVDNFNGAAGSGADEVTLDIELEIALAPHVDRILVYEAPNGSGILDCYNRIATDNLAKSVSTSWGVPEATPSAAFRNAENTIFQQMAAQGQSVFAAAGDQGAYDNGSTLSVDDPASQPLVTGVGGTTLTVGSGGTRLSETTWNDGAPQNTGGGGGISTVWPIPSYQSGVVNAATLGSATSRNVPDVSLNAGTGYAIYLAGGWHLFGGTSAAAPLWSAFFGLVNQARSAGGVPVIGQANPALYHAAAGAGAGADYHDIADGSNNRYYPAVTGYDCATGWGTFNGASLLADLAGGGGGGSSIHVTAPNGGETWALGSAHAVTWTAVNISNTVTVELSRNSGATWESLGAWPSASGAVNVTVGGAATTHARVRVSDQSNPAVNDTSDADFTLTAAPGISLTSPLGGESWAAGTAHPITWTATGLSGSVNVELSRDGGATYAALGTAPATAGSLTWTVTGPATQQAIIRVSQASGGGTYSSVSGSFTISDPTGGLPAAPTDLVATALSSTEIRLAWTDHATNESGYKVEVRTDSGSYQEIPGLSLGAGAAGVTLAGAHPSTAYYFRVRAYNTAGTSAYSNEAQVITPGVPPPAPTMLKAKPQSGTAILLSWKYLGSTEQGFKVEVLQNGTFVQLGTTAATIRSVRVVNLVPRTSYSFRVRAYNAGGDSAYSNVATARTRNR